MSQRSLMLVPGQELPPDLPLASDLVEGEMLEVLPLNAATAPMALQAIFSADRLWVWGKL